MTVTKYHSKLVGVTFEDRQGVIAKLTGEEELRFRREADNEYDSNAVAVDVCMSEVWLPVGYIAKDKNAELAKVLDDKKYARIKISEITGGEDKNYGINVEIEYEKQPVISGKLLKDFFGNEIYYDEVNHVYSWNGEVYESGSQYASKFEKPFDKHTIAGKMASKYGVEAQEIIEMWELNGRTSMEFGTAIHSALELYGKHRKLAKALERDSALHAHPVVRRAVEGFYEGRENEVAHYEVLVVDHTRKRAGRIDRLQMLEGDYVVQDFKTNAVLKPDKLKVYWAQLGFYSGIIRANGGSTRPEQIFHYDGLWETIERRSA